MTLKSLLSASWFLKVVFGGGLFLILCVGGLAYKHMQELDKSMEMLAHTYQVNVELEQINSYLKDAELGKRGYLITGDASFLKPYYISRENINNSLARIKALLEDNAVQREHLKLLKQKIDKRLELFNAALRLAQTSTVDSKAFRDVFAEGKIVMDEIHDDISVMIAVENKLLKRRMNENEKNLSLTPIFLYSLLIVTLVIMLLTYAKINKDLKALKIKNEQLEIFKETTSQAEIISEYGNWSWRVEDNTFYFSDNFYRLLGEEPQAFEANLENFWKFVHPDDLDKLKKEVDYMLANKELPASTYRIIQKDGTIRHLKAYSKLLLNSEGVQTLIGITADITEEVKSRQLIEDRNLELERSNKELSAFNYVASHDLQEPLRKIQTFISRLEDKESVNLSESGKKYMERIKNAAGRMRLLIDDLLQFSRTNRTEKVFELCDINMLLENAKEEVAEDIAFKKAKITASNFPEMKVIPFQIQQLFINLLNNSLKYSKKEISPVIDIVYEKVNSNGISEMQDASKGIYHKIIYTDNGIGFESEYADKIFELFSRLHTKNEYSGTGIGLSICKKIVENHKGYIFAKGEPNAGAIFTIYLPIV